MLISPKTPRHSARCVTDVARRRMNLASSEKDEEEEGGREGEAALSKWMEVRGGKKETERSCVPGNLSSATVDR